MDDSKNNQNNDQDEIELDDEYKDYINLSMLNIIVTRILAEVATIDRSPKEAKAFIDSLKKEIDIQINKFNSKGKPIDRAWAKEQRFVLNKIFDHITFEAKK